MCLLFSYGHNMWVSFGMFSKWNESLDLTDKGISVEFFTIWVGKKMVWQTILFKSGQVIKQGMETII